LGHPLNLDRGAKVLTSPPHFRRRRMRTVEYYGKIDLEVGERVVAATTFRDYVLVITDYGNMYRITSE